MSFLKSCTTGELLDELVERFGTIGIVASQASNQEMPAIQLFKGEMLLLSGMLTTAQFICSQRFVEEIKSRADSSIQMDVHDKPRPFKFPFHG